MSKTTTLGIALILVAVMTFGIIWYRNRPSADVPLVFSARAMLDTLWQNYKHSYVEPDTFRTIDKQQENITTSEGQSYTMLRAVFMDDQPTFDGAFQWTKDNLGRDEDKLFSWLFGEDSDGKFRVLRSKGGYNSASDADVDIALALIFAHRRWNREEYLGDALALLADIWKYEVVEIGGVPYLAANNVERLSTERIIVNPSYLAPYAYRIFAEVDRRHDWMKLVDSSYVVLNAASSAPLDKESSVQLPPDWIVINRKTGAVTSADLPNLTTNFSFDALRVPWRVAVDYAWNREPRAKAYLNKLAFLSQEWGEKGKIAAAYSHDGKIVNEAEVPAMYGGVMGYFMVSDPAHAEDVYRKKLVSLYNPDTNSWKRPLSYYDDNWAWFGIGLYNNLIKPL